MIVSAHPDGLLLVRQVDHQEQCGAMAEAWGGDGFAMPAHAGSLIEAARRHDEGWRAWEARPGVDEGGRPVNFPDIDRTAHVTLYREGIDTVERRDPRAGLIVSMHGAGLYRGRLGLDHVVHGSGARPPAVEEFLAHEDRRQATIRARLGNPGEEERWAWAAYRLLQAWDLLSLALVWGRLAGRTITLARVPRGVDDTQGVDLTVTPRAPHIARVSPWPWPGDELALPVDARVVPDRAYTDADDLAEAIDRARPRIVAARAVAA